MTFDTETTRIGFIGLGVMGRSMAGHLLARAQGSNAKGVIGFTVKFCDPYLARIPMIRDTLKEAGLPFLTIEGDCTTGAMGQQQTRIEAFTEMLEG